jgi:hypothetical protein
MHPPPLVPSEFDMAIGHPSALGAVLSAFRPITSIAMERNLDVEFLVSELAALATGQNPALLQLVEAPTERAHLNHPAKVTRSHLRVGFGLEAIALAASWS